MQLYKAVQVKHPLEVFLSLCDYKGKINICNWEKTSDTQVLLYRNVCLFFQLHQLTYTNAFAIKEVLATV